MATNYLSDEEVFGKPQYLSEDEVFGVKAEAEPEITAPVKERGIVDRVTSALPAPIRMGVDAAKAVAANIMKPDTGYKSVLETQAPTAAQDQAEIDKRLSYGAGPISKETVAKADLARSGMGKVSNLQEQRVAQEMEQRGQKSFGEMAQDAKRGAEAAKEEQNVFSRASDELGAGVNEAKQALTLTKWAVSGGDTDALSKEMAISMTTPQIKTKGEKEIDAAFKRVSDAKGFMNTALEGYRAIATAALNPKDTMMEALRSAPSSVPTLAGGVAGAVAGIPTGPAGMIALGKTGMAAGTTAIELGSEVRDMVGKVLADRKLAPTAANIKSILDDDGFREEAAKQGAIKGLTVAAIDNIFLGIGGKVATAPAKSALGKAAAGGSAVVVDAAGESLGEGLSQQFARGTVDYGEALREGTSSIGQSVAQTAAGSAIERAQGIGAAFEQPIQAAAPEVSTAEQMARERGFLTPERPATQLTNFTPDDSPTKAAGLVDIVVPVPVAAPALTPLAEVQINPETEQQFGLDKLRLGTTNVGVPSTVGTTNVPSGAGGGVADLGSLGTTGPSVAGPTGGMAPLATTTELGGGQAAAIGATVSEQPATLKQEWYGRRGDGYLTKPDAEQALAGRARMFPDLQWQVDQLPTGKYRLAGYETNAQAQVPTTQAEAGLPTARTTTQPVEATGLETQFTPQETTLGTQTTQAFQAAQEGQQAPTFGTTATTTTGAFAPDVQGAQPPVVGLKLAPAASMRVIRSVRKELIDQNVEIATVPQAEMNESQQVASAVANMLGKTLTVVRYESGDQNAMPNGMIDRLGGDNIFVANDTEDSTLFVVMHEAHHGLPNESRAKLNAALNSLFREELRGEFAREFNYTEDKLDEEIPAFMVQAISKRADFWEQLRAKMGNKDFAEVAKQILSKLNEIITGSRREYGNDFVTKYIKDVEKARDLLTTAYAEAINNKAAAPQAKQVAPITGPVSKEEAVVDGVMFSSRSRNLVELPTIDFKDLLGKRVFGIKADLTDAGVSYTGIDGSQLQFPIEMMGGPNFVALPENVKSNVVWAVRGGATLTKIMKVVNDSDYIIVHAMNSNSHLTNATISQAYIQTVEAYLKDNRISRENLLALDKIVRSPANKNSLPDFVGFESPNIIEYIDGLSFDQRGALAKMLEKKEAQIHGLPNIERFRRETIDPEYAGYRQGDAMLVIEIDKENPTVKLGEEGTKMHPSYPLGLRGKVVGKLSKGINYELIYRDYFENKVPTLGNKEAGAWYTFDRVMPVQEITPEIAASVSEGGYKAIKSARQAEASLALANDNWLVSGKTKADGGVSIQEFVDALASNDGAAALTMYTPEQVKTGIKDKSFSVYQLGKQGGDKGLQVFFGLKRGAPWYKDMIEGVSDNEVEVVSVTNNETGAQGVGIPAIITKAIQEGATILDAFAVKSKRFPDGFLPEMYSQFGFETIGSIPFDASYYDANQMADLKKFWTDGGWKESDGYPDVVVMKWKGNDDERATSIERYVREGQTSVSVGSARFNGSTTENAHGQRNQPRAKQGRGRGADSGQARGDQGVGNATPVVRRAYDSIQELATLSDGDIRNLGLDPAEVAKLKQSLGGVQFSKRAGSPEPIGRSSIGRDKGDAVKVEGAIHYGRSAGLSVLSGTSFGSGIKGAEQARLSGVGVDPRIKRRVYFYLPMAGGIPQPEIGLGTNVYTANLSNLYDPSVGARKFPATPNEFESAVLDAGFRGYINRAQGTAVVLNSDVPVKAVGKSSEQTMVQRKPQMVAEKISTREDGGELVRKPTEREMMDIIKVRPELTKQAPSFKLEYGSARVAIEEAPAANAVLEEVGSTFMFSNRAKPEYTHVVFDPRNGDKVMGRYQSIEAARRGQDRLDNQYGGYRYQIREIKTNEVRFSSRSIGEALQERINEDIEQVIGEYEDLKGTDGGRILDTDMVRELSPEYRADRSRAAEVYEASSFLTQAMFDSRIANNDAGVVAFMAGGGGAGKSTAEDLASKELKSAHTVLDGTLSSYEKAKRNVQTAINAGNKALVVYVYREPVEALRNGVLTRAERMGRTVTIDALVKGHAGSSTVVRKLQEEFGDNPMFELVVIDNSRGQGKAKIANLSDITPVIQSGLKERLQNATESEFQAGRIGETVYRATTASYPDSRGSDQARLGSEGSDRRTQGGVQGRAGSEQLQLSLTKLFTDLRGARGLKLARVQEQVENNPLSKAIKNVEENFYDIVGQLEEDGLIKINCK